MQINGFWAPRPRTAPKPLSIKERRMMKSILWMVATLMLVATHATALNFAIDEETWAPSRSAFTETLVIIIAYGVGGILIFSAVVGIIGSIYIYCWRVYTYGWRRLVTPLFFSCEQCGEQVWQAECSKRICEKCTARQINTRSEKEAGA
jgi:hypothetical protein